MTTPELAEAIAALPAMEPVGRAVACAELMRVARGVLAAERAAAMAEATGPGGVSRAELARALGVNRKQVTQAIADHGAR